MPIQAQVSFVQLADVRVNKEQRQRQGDLDIESLASSIKRNGLINPPVVHRETLELVAGERRLEACRSLGWTELPIRFAEDLSPTDLQILELEENIKRKDLDWKDIVRGVGTIHKLYRTLDPDWTMSETARELNVTLGWVSTTLSVEAKLGEEKIGNSGTVREAWNKIRRAEQRKAGEALEELTGGGKPQMPELQPSPIKVTVDLAKPGSDKTTYTVLDTQTGKSFVVESREEAERIVRAIPVKPVVPLAPQPDILNLSFLDWVETYKGPKFNLIHCDFPYGVNLFNGPQGKGAEPGSMYEDTQEIYWALVDSLAQNLDNIMTLSGHLMFWLSADWQIVSKTIKRFADCAPSLEFHKFPMIWLKSDNAGIASDPTRGPRHTYEACLFASRAKRQIVKIKADSYSAATDKRLHPSTKPVSVLKHFMEMIVDENTTLLDPTCGSGAALRAAESLGAKKVLGLEIDPDYCNAALAELKRDRVLRVASARVEQKEQKA